jgi:hypothetical protein
MRAKPDDHILIFTYLTSSMPQPQVSHLDEVLPTLEYYLDKATAEGSPIGYFAALYRITTRKIVTAIQEKQFEDNERMARMDVNFANRYFAALHAHYEGGTPSRSWGVTFEAAAQWSPTVIQHLFMGMNAHINYDLAIAAAKTCPGDAIYGFEKDFDAINQILDSLMNRVQDDMAKIWKPLRFLIKLAGGAQNLVLNAAMQAERDSAWRKAVKIATMPATEREAYLEELDKRIAHIGEIIMRPGILVSIVLFVVRITEIGTVKSRIKALS